jgi:uncharacterized protein YjbJ (UPF0337 family)
MIRETELTVDWNDQKSKLKQKYVLLTDNDLHYEAGKKDEMLGKLQVRLGKTKEQLRLLIASL